MTDASPRTPSPSTASSASSSSLLFWPPGLANVVLKRDASAAPASSGPSALPADLSSAPRSGHGSAASPVRHSSQWSAPAAAAASSSSGGGFLPRLRRSPPAAAAASTDHSAHWSAAFGGGCGGCGRSGAFPVSNAGSDGGSGGGGGRSSHGTPASRAAPVRHLLTSWLRTTATAYMYYLDTFTSKEDI